MIDNKGTRKERQFKEESSVTGGKKTQQDKKKAAVLRTGAVFCV